MLNFILLIKRFLLATCLSSFVFINLVFSQMIPLTPAMVFDEVGGGSYPGNILDEQAKIGDPKSGKGNIPTTKWHPGTEDEYYPASVIIDLKANHSLTDFYIYDGNNSSRVTVEYGVPSKWESLLVDPLTKSKVWNGHKINVETRYLKITLNERFEDFYEIALYGTANGEPEKDPEPTPHLQPTVDQFIGVNALVTSPIDKLVATGMVREYHPWMWNEGNINFNSEALTTSYKGYPNNLNKFSLSYVGFDFDDYYTKLKDAGIMAVPCIKESVSWLTTHYQHKPINKGADSYKPESYAAHADFMYQYIARYGSVKVADSKLKLASDQKRLSGLNLIKYIENWNEPDMWWEGKNAFFHPHELAAMCSADYDGHQKKMGTTVGIKNADPAAKLVMPGLAKPSLDYIKSMKMWSDVNRAGSFPADVINLHHYSTDAGGQFGTFTTGVSPEEDRLKERFKVITDYRNKYLPGKEVWVSEFGYATNPESKFKAPKIGSFSQQEVQGQWLVRSLLELAAAGVDRTFLYWLVDNGPDEMFSHCGITTTLPLCEPKLSWYYIYTMKNNLSGMRFSHEENTNADNIRAYAFKNSSSSNGAFVIWSPTADGKEIANYEFSVGLNAKSAKLVSLVGGSTVGEETSLNIVNGKVKVDVSERPVFILVDKLSVPVLNTLGKELTNITIYPTRTDKDVFIDIAGFLSGKNAQLTLFDSKGVAKHTETINLSSGSYFKIDISNLDAGIYLLNMECDEGIKTQKIVKF